MFVGRRFARPGSIAVAQPPPPTPPTFRCFYCLLNRCYNCPDEVEILWALMADWIPSLQVKQSDALDVWTSRDNWVSLSYHVQNFRESEIQRHNLRRDLARIEDRPLLNPRDLIIYHHEQYGEYIRKDYRWDCFSREALLLKTSVDIIMRRKLGIPKVIDIHTNIVRDAVFGLGDVTCKVAEARVGLLYAGTDSAHRRHHSTPTAPIYESKKKPKKPPPPVPPYTKGSQTAHPAEPPARRTASSAESSVIRNQPPRMQTHNTTQTNEVSSRTTTSSMEGPITSDVPPRMQAHGTTTHTNRVSSRTTTSSADMPVTRVLPPRMQAYDTTQNKSSHATSVSADAPVTYEQPPRMQALNRTQNNNAQHISTSSYSASTPKPAADGTAQVANVPAAKPITIAAAPTTAIVSRTNKTASTAAILPAGSIRPRTDGTAQVASVPTARPITTPAAPAKTTASRTIKTYSMAELLSLESLPPLTVLAAEKLAAELYYHIANNGEPGQTTKILELVAGLIARAKAFEERTRAWQHSVPIAVQGCSSEDVDDEGWVTSANVPAQTAPRYNPETQHIRAATVPHTPHLIATTNTTQSQPIRIGPSYAHEVPPRHAELAQAETNAATPHPQAKHVSVPHDMPAASFDMRLAAAAPEYVPPHRRDVELTARETSSATPRPHARHVSVALDMRAAVDAPAFVPAGGQERALEVSPSDGHALSARATEYVPPHARDVQLADTETNPATPRPQASRVSVPVDMRAAAAAPVFVPAPARAVLVSPYQVEELAPTQGTYTTSTLDMHRVVSAPVFVPTGQSHAVHVASPGTQVAASPATSTSPTAPFDMRVAVAAPEFVPPQAAPVGVYDALAPSAAAPFNMRRAATAAPEFVPPQAIPVRISAPISLQETRATTPPDFVPARSTHVRISAPPGLHDARAAAAPDFVPRQVTPVRISAPPSLQDARVAAAPDFVPARSAPVRISAPPSLHNTRAAAAPDFVPAQAAPVRISAPPGVAAPSEMRLAAAPESVPPQAAQAPPARTSSPSSPEDIRAAQLRFLQLAAQAAAARMDARPNPPPNPNLPPRLQDRVVRSSAPPPAPALESPEEFDGLGSITPTAYRLALPLIPTPPPASPEPEPEYSPLPPPVPPVWGAGYPFTSRDGDYLPPFVPCHPQCHGDVCVVIALRRLRRLETVPEEPSEIWYDDDEEQRRHEAEVVGLLDSAEQAYPGPVHTYPHLEDDEAVARVLHKHAYGPEIVTVIGGRPPHVVVERKRIRSAECLELCPYDPNVDDFLCFLDQGVGEKRRKLKLKQQTT